LRVGVLSSGHIPSEWAHSAAVVKNAQGFHDAGCETHLLSPRRHKETEKLKHTTVPEFYGLSEEINVTLFPDVTPFYFQDSSIIGFTLMGLRKATRDLIRRPLDPEGRMARYCLDQDLDLAYCRTYRSVKYCVERGVPVIMESHSSEVNRPAKRQALNCSSNDKFKLLVTISEKLKQEFVQWGVPEAKITVLQDGVKLGRFDSVDKTTARTRLELPHERSIVMYTGSLYPDKGIEHILLVASRTPNVEFIIVGGPEEEQERWVEYTADRDLQNVTFTGFVPNKRIPTYLAAADVLIMPYNTDQSIDVMDIDTTSPLKLFEYMAARRPIVTTDIPAIARTIEHKKEGLLAAPNDISELVESTTRALSNDTLATHLANNAREKAKEYTWRNRARKMLQQAGFRLEVSP